MITMLLVLVLISMLAALRRYWKRFFPSLHHRKLGEVSAPKREMGGSHHSPRLLGRVVKVLLRAGVPIRILGNPVFLLTVRGRTTGQPRTTLVDLYEGDGRSFLVASHGESDWVRNLRAAGEGTLRRGGSLRAFTAVVLTPEAAGSVLKEVLGPRLSDARQGFVLRRALGVAPDASLEDFIHLAGRCPVFELDIASHQPGRSRSKTRARTEGKLSEALTPGAHELRNEVVKGSGGGK